MNWSEIQNAVLDAIEQTRGSASPHHHISYGMGYDAAKRDVIVQVAMVFARLEAKESKRDEGVSHGN